MDRTRLLSIVARIVVVVGLGIDGVIHLHLASRYQMAQPHGIGEGTLFRIDAILAFLAALYVLLRASRLSFAVAAVVGLGGLAAVLAYRYIAKPAIAADVAHILQELAEDT